MQFRLDSKRSHTWCGALPHAALPQDSGLLYAPPVAALEAAPAPCTDSQLMMIAGTIGVPYVFVRANSDYTYGPVKRAADGRAWIPAESAVPANNTLGYKFAIATSSTAVLTLLQHRCLALASASVSDLCNFSPLQV